MLNGAKVDIQKVNSSDFEALPADKYTVQITDVNLQKQFNSFKQIEEEVLNYEFTVLDNKTMDVDKDGKTEIETLRGRKLWRRCTPKLGKKTWLSKLASAALGHELTGVEEDEFQPESIIDKQVDVLVEVVEGTGKNAGNMYNNITAFSVTKKELNAFDNDKTKQGAVRETKPVDMSDTESDDFIKGLEKEEK